MDFANREKRTAFLDFMKNIDIFGEKVTLTHRKSSVYKSRVGACATLILYLWVMVFVVGGLAKVYN